MGELLTKLGIDWRLLIAQLVNFAILFVLLRRFLYRPILQGLTERRERIAKGLADAEAASVRRREIDLERQEVLHRAESERRAMLEAAANDAEALRHQRAAAAEAEGAAIVARAKVESERVRAEVLGEAHRQLGDLIIAATEKVTSDRLPDSVHDAIVKAAVEEARSVRI